MDLRQAQIRNMHSKCRCSYVLQFTRHHRVSSVLHRPPSQMIHCIVLCFDSLNSSQEGWASQQKDCNNCRSRHGGKCTTWGWARHFKPTILRYQQPQAAQAELLTSNQKNGSRRCRAHRQAGSQELAAQAQPVPKEVVFAMQTA